jgi:ubiquinol-cytochrome c reductase cytochrome b subunit
MWKLVDFKDYAPTLARPNSQGKITVGARVRASLSSFFFEDRIAPVTQSELDAAHHDHGHDAVAEKPAKAVSASAAAKKPATKKPAAKKPAAKKK